MSPENALLFSSPIKQSSTSNKSTEKRNKVRSQRKVREVKLSPENALLFSSPIKQSSDDMSSKLKPKNSDQVEHTLAADDSVYFSESDEKFLASFDELEPVWDTWSEKGESSNSRWSTVQSIRKDETTLEGSTAPLTIKFAVHETFGYDIVRAKRIDVSHYCSSTKVCSPFTCFTTILNPELQSSTTSSPTLPMKECCVGSPGLSTPEREEAVKAFNYERVPDEVKEKQSSIIEVPPKPTESRKRKLEESEIQKDQKRSKHYHTSEKRSGDKNGDSKRSSEKIRDDKTKKHKHSEKTKESKNEKDTKSRDDKSKKLKDNEKTKETEKGLKRKSHDEKTKESKSEKDSKSKNYKSKKHDEKTKESKSEKDTKSKSEMNRDDKLKKQKQEEKEKPKENKGKSEKDKKPKNSDKTKNSTKAEKQEKSVPIWKRLRLFSD
jgi:hypothetical protein